MNIRWIGQSGYVLWTDTTKIIIDPYLSDVVNRVAGRPRMVKAPIEPGSIDADAVICTHDHLDHLDVDAIELMSDSLMFITTVEGKEKLLTLGKTRVNTLSIGESVCVGDFTLTAVYGNHTVESFGLIVEGEGKTLYFSGDTLFDERLFEIADYKPDIAFLCINGKLGNMNVEEAVVVADKICAKLSVPNHYGMFASNTEDPNKFTSVVNNSMELDFDVMYSVDELIK